MEKYFTTKEGGKKSVIEILEWGRQWKRDLLEKGYEETPDGLLPMTEIKRAGYVLNEKGEWRIPSEEYMADGNSERPAGEKYIGPSSQYLNWRNSKKYQSYKKQEVKEDNKLNLTGIKATPIVKDSDEIDVDAIPF